MATKIERAKSSGGARIAYAGLGDGPPVVFASNAFGDLHFYQSLHPHTRRMTDGLVERGYRVLRHDLRGTGSSSRSVAEISVAALLDDLEAVVEASGLRSFALAGLHCGAATAVHYAVQHPEHVTQLVLLNPFVSGANRFELDPVGRTVSSLAPSAMDDWSFFTLIAGNLMTNFSNPEHARALATMFQQSTSPETHLRYLAAMRAVELRTLLPQVQVPTLVVHDTGFPFGAFADCEEVAAALPRSRLQVIPGDGEAELAAIDAFLRDNVPVAKAPASTGGSGARLTRRETEVLRQIALGKTNREISGDLVLSERTVSRHITNIYGKLGLHSKAEATAYAIHHGIA